MSSGPVMLFPDPRFRSPTADGYGRFGNFGLTDASAEPCDLSWDLRALSDALEKANALGLYNQPVVYLAQQLYNGDSAIQVSHADCASVISGIRSMTTQVVTLVNANLPPGDAPLPMPPGSLPSWLLPVGIAVGAVIVAVTIGGAVARAKRKNS